MQTYNYYFYGKVQKTSFRKTLKNICDKYNIYGFVQNETKNFVFAKFQQRKEILDNFLPLLRTYLELENKNILIKKIVKKKIKTIKKYSDFKINYSSPINKLLSNVHFKLNNFINLNSNIKILPNHIVLIPDGNRRWLKKNKIPIKKFYFIFVKKGEEMLSYLNKKQNIFDQKLYFTLWGFSTENWNRNSNDIELVFGGLIYFLDQFLIKKTLDFKFKHLGRKDRLPSDLLLRLNKLEEKTKNSESKLYFNLALDYGGRDEIIRAIKKLNKNEIKDLTEENFNTKLDTVSIPDPDLIIRTSGEQRLSGIFPFQSTYSELYFSKKKFPEFQIKDLELALKEFQKRKRNFGK